MKLLVVDDEDLTLTAISVAMRKLGHEVATHGTAEAALASLDRGYVPDVALIDVFLPGTDGIELLESIMKRVSLPVVVMTGSDSASLAVRAMKAGASEFLLKPFDADLMEVLLQRAIESWQLARENTRLRAEAAAHDPGMRLIGRSPQMQLVTQRIAEFAASAAPVLVTGETGTGKELVAREIHAASRRDKGPFVAVNCAAIPAELFEAEFFGYEKGAFTGATTAQVGRLEQAAGGTMFLDEIGAMPLALQSKLLRSLQEKEFERVGSRRMLQADVRIVAATNVDLEQAVAEGQFRADLFYRLRVLWIHLPPLRERISDIPLLTSHFLERFAAGSRHAPQTMTPEALRALLAHSWPGNVRELAGVLERAALLTRGAIGLEHLPRLSSAGVRPYDEELTELREAFERQYLGRLLSEAKGDLRSAVRLSGLSERHLVRLRQKHGHATRSRKAARAPRPTDIGVGKGAPQSGASSKRSQSTRPVRRMRHK